MQSYLIRGGRPLLDDAKIWSFISGRVDSWRPGIGDPRRIALLGANDQPYRVIVANGSDEFDTVCTNLRDIGLTTWGGDESTPTRVLGTDYAAVFGRDL